LGNNDGIGILLGLGALYLLSRSLTGGGGGGGLAWGWGGDIIVNTPAGGGSFVTTTIPRDSQRANVWREGTAEAPHTTPEGQKAFFRTKKSRVVTPTGITYTEDIPRTITITSPTTGRTVRTALPRVVSRYKVL